MGPKRQVQIDGSKETDPKSTQKVSKWVRHNQVSWFSLYIYLYFYIRSALSTTFKGLTIVFFANNLMF